MNLMSLLIRQIPIQNSIVAARFITAVQRVLNSKRAKEDWGFRRFLTRGTVAVETQIGLLAFAFNIKKLFSKRRDDRAVQYLFPLNSA